MNNRNFHLEFKYGNPVGSMHGYNSISSAIDGRELERPLWQRTFGPSLIEQLVGWFRNRRRVSGLEAPATAVNPETLAHSQ